MPSITPALTVLVPTLALIAGGLSAAEFNPVPGGTAPKPTPKPAPQVEPKAVEGEGSITVIGEDGALPQASSTKLDIPLQETPQTVTLITEDLLRQTGGYTLRDALRLTPGVTLLAGEQGTTGDRMFIRGFAANQDIFLDGMRDTGQYYRDAFNIEQVEILKGPSGMLFGRGTTGGAVNSITKKPTYDEWTGDGSYAIGSYNFARFQGGVSGPVKGDQVGVRLDTFVQSNESHRDEQDFEYFGIAPSVGIQLAPETNVVLQYMHQEQDGTIDYGVPMYNGTPIDMPVNTYYGFRDDTLQDTNTDIYSAILNHRMSEDVTVRNTTRYGESDRLHRTERINSINYTTNVGTRSQTLFGSDWTSLANQAELSWLTDVDGKELQVVAGIEGSLESYENKTKASTPADPNVFLIDLFNPNSAATVGAGRADDFTDPTGHTRAELQSLAAYGLIAYDVTETVNVSFGLRAELFIADVTNYISNQDFESTDVMPSPRGGVVWTPVPEWSFYASAGMSYNPSAEGYGLSTSTTETDPEKTLAFEIGAKGELLDGALGLTAALFRIDKFQARTPSTVPGEPNVLDGKVENVGIELGATGSITENWTVFGGIVLMDPEIVESNTAAQVGKQMQNTPETSGNLWTTYALGHGLSVGGGVTYVSERWANDTNTVQVPSYVKVDLSATYETGIWYAQLNIFNLFDEVYYDQTHSLFAIPGAPLSGQFSIGAAF